MASDPKIDLPQGALPELTLDSRRRYRQAFLSSLGLAVAKVCSLAAMLLLVPVLLKYLDSERFGLWMTFTSVMASMAFADLGLGYGLMTAVASTSARDDPRLLQRLVSSGFAAIVAIAVPTGIVLFAIGIGGSWNSWLGVAHVPISELRFAVIAVMLGLVATGVAGIAGRVQAGLQQGYIASLWTAVGTLSAVGAVVLCVHFGVAFAGLLFCFIAVPIGVSAINSLWYLGKRSPDLRPRLAAVDWAKGRALFRLGLLFFVLQVAAAITFATDNLMIASVLGAGAVADYAIPARLFACVSLAVSIVLQPLWPAYAEAQARGDLRWIRRAYTRSVMVAFVLSIGASGVLYFFRDVVFPLWTQTVRPIDSRVVAGLAVWAVIDSYSIAMAMLLNGLNVVRFQVIVAVVLTVTSFPIRIYMLRHFGVAGLPVATVVVCVITAILPCMVVIPRLLKQGPGLG